MTPELARKRAEEIVATASRNDNAKFYPRHLAKQILTLAADVAESCAPKQLDPRGLSDEEMKRAVWYDHAIDEMRHAASLYREASK